MEEKEERGGTLSFMEDGEMNIPLAHLPRYTDSPQNIVDIWLEKINNNELTPANFKDHWKIWVPKFYALEPGSDWNLENEKSNDSLVENLERFIANGDFDEATKKLQNLDHPPSVCGRVFQVSVSAILNKINISKNDCYFSNADCRLESQLIPAGSVLWMEPVSCVSVVSNDQLTKIIVTKWAQV